MPSLDTIKFNGVDYEVKRKLTFGEVRQFQKTVGSLLGMDEKIKTATDEELEKLAEEGLKSTGEQMELVSDTIMKCLDFTQEQVNLLSFPEAIILFNEVFNSSTQIKKKSNQPYV